MTAGVPGPSRARFLAVLISGASLHNCTDVAPSAPTLSRRRLGRNASRGDPRPAPGGQDHARTRAGRSPAFGLSRSGDRQRPGQALRARAVSAAARGQARHPRRDPSHAAAVPHLARAHRRRQAARAVAKDGFSSSARHRSICSSHPSEVARRTHRATSSSPRSTRARSGRERLDALWLRGGFPESFSRASDGKACVGGATSFGPTSSAISRSSGRASRPRRCGGSGRCWRTSRAAAQCRASRSRVSP